MYMYGGVSTESKSTISLAKKAIYNVDSLSKGSAGPELTKGLTESRWQFIDKVEWESLGVKYMAKNILYKQQMGCPYNFLT